MNLLKVDFSELYQRHLRRHSQFGINLLHLIAVAAIYFAIYATTFILPGSPWVLAAILGVYLLLLLVNLPFLLWLANALVVGLLVGACFLLPPMPWWIVIVYLAVILTMHRFQNWSHKVYHKSLDMSEFQAKYRKGPLLFTLLSVYELPILLNYLLFDRRSWTS